jgi:NTP pyrophosphatase (non-canonical NTP hydrolase)
MSADQQPDKYVTPCELPTPHEREILTILIEECAEVQQRATKLLRFGRDEVQPGQPHNNRERLSGELGDLNAIVEMAANYGLVALHVVWQQELKKRAKLRKYMQTVGASAGNK